MYWWWKLGFPSKVENITITCTLEFINWSSLEVVWCRRIFHDNEMRKLRLCSRNPHDWTAQTLKRAYTGLNHTGSQARIYVYVEENVQTLLYIYYSLSGLQRIASIFSSSIKPPSLTNWFSLSKIRNLRSFFSFDFKILIIKHRRRRT